MCGNDCFKDCFKDQSLGIRTTILVENEGEYILTKIYLYGVTQAGASGGDNIKKGSRTLGAAGRLEFLVVFGPFWPLEVSTGTKLYNRIVQFNRTYSLIFILVPIETSSGHNGPKTTKNSNRLAAPSVLDPMQQG